MLHFSRLFLAFRFLLWVPNTRYLTLSIALEFCFDMIKAHTIFNDAPNTTSIVLRCEYGFFIEPNTMNDQVKPPVIPWPGIMWHKAFM
jgi:hypothetical protein